MPQLTACFYLELLMRIYFFSDDRSHQRVNSIEVRKVNAHQDLEMKTRGQLRNLGAMDVVRNNFPYLHRRIWAHSVVARRLFSQLHGASCA